MSRSIGIEFSSNPPALIRTAVQLGQRLAHHVQLGLTISFEHASILLPQHLRDEVIGDAPGAQARGKGMAQFVYREIGNAGALGALNLEVRSTPPAVTLRPVADRALRTSRTRSTCCSSRRRVRSGSRIRTLGAVDCAKAQTDKAKGTNAIR